LKKTKPLTKKTYDPSSQSATFAADTLGLIDRIEANPMPKHVILFHEMVHAYQITQEIVCKF
jgi:hypothetical protein